jgi:UDP-N-acetylglucosamine diphosphorylase/glucosamine-1-phosphate N-acetyltransferase
MKRWLILVEGAAAGQFAPLDLTRPGFFLRDGAFTNAERWIALLRPTAVAYETRAQFQPLLSELAPTAGEKPARAGAQPDEIWTIEGLVQPLDDPRWVTGRFPDFSWSSGTARISKVSARVKSAPPAPSPMPFRALDGLWNLIEHLPEQLLFDFALWSRSHRKTPARVPGVSRGVHIVGDRRRLRVGRGVTIHPQNVLNTATGPIILDDNVTLEPFNRIDGPAYIGKATALLGGKFTGGAAIGPGCKIGGEWEASIAQGFVNKAHAGFFGHGILGEWVNLGAMTTNSDLKNTYGTVRVARDGAEVETGLIKVGSFIADHSKTGIGTLIPTGATWGVGVNYFGGDLAPRDLPSFVWGTRGNLVEHRLDRMLSTAAAAMARRAAVLRALARPDGLTDTQRMLLTAVFDATAAARGTFLRRQRE